MGPGHKYCLNMSPVILVCSLELRTMNQMTLKISFKWYSLFLNILIVLFPHVVSREQNCMRSQALFISAKNFPSIKAGYLLLVLMLLLFSRTTCYSSPIQVHLSPFLLPPFWVHPNRQFIQAPQTASESFICIAFEHIK